MNIRVEEINYFGGLVAVNRLELLSGITEKDFFQADNIKLLEVAYGENTLSVIAEIENGINQVSIISQSTTGQTVQKRDIHQEAEIAHEIQIAIYRLIKTASWCPQIFCFFWQEAGDYAAPGLYSSRDEAVKNLKPVEKDQCGFGYGTCRRNVGGSGMSNFRDYYEPCEPRLRRNALPDHFFVQSE